MRRKIIFLFSLFWTLNYGVSAQPEKAAAAIDSIVAHNPVVGIAVAVEKDGKLIYVKSFGYKNLEAKTPLTNESIFRIASISKSFTSTGIMQLVQEKRMKLSDDVSKLVGFKVRNPNYPDKVITVRMILSHTSSINDSQGYFSLDDIDPAKNPEWQKCYNNYAPGAGYQYCNLNYNLAGTILERVSGERFDHYVFNHILRPLHLYGGYNVNDLDSSRFAMLYEYNSDSSKFILSASAYSPRKKEIQDYVPGFSTPIFSPAGGMKITASDLAKYMMMHSNNGKLNGVRIISRKSEKEMRKPLSEKEHYGLGLLTTKKLIPGETLIGHTGGAYGLSSAMFFQPHKKFGIVVISNGVNLQFTEGYNTVIREVVNSLYNTLLK